MNQVRAPIEQTQTFTTELKNTVIVQKEEADYNIYFRLQANVRSLTPTEVINCYDLFDYVPKLVQNAPDHELDVQSIGSYFDLTYQKSRKVAVLELEPLFQDIIRGSKTWAERVSEIVHAIDDWENKRYYYDNFRMIPTGLRYDKANRPPELILDLVWELKNEVFKTVFDVSNYELIQMQLLKEVFGNEYQSVKIRLNKKFTSNNIIDGIDYYGIERQLSNMPLAYGILNQDGPSIELLKLVTIQYLVRLGDQVSDNEDHLIVQIPSVTQGKSTYNERYGITSSTSFHVGLTLIWLWATIREEILPSDEGLL